MEIDFMTPTTKQKRFASDIDEQEEIEKQEKIAGPTSEEINFFDKIRYKGFH